jgi:NADPH-dependent glutamate synthase beta subunit-like oxidoreductase
MSVNETFKKHYIAIIGGSISGSEAAILLAQNGFRVVVFEMNKLPYGKIEDGLPNWHVNLRDRQIKEIDSKLNHPNIRFVPNTKIGEAIDFIDLVVNWGFSAIILANGAWVDRKLPVRNIERFRDKELIYQNSFIHWFNHKHERNYLGKNYFIKNNAVIIGGGLASLDVVKIVMIELVKKQLFLTKGIDIDLFTLEKKGIASVLNEFDVKFSDLNIGKATLVYRRTAKEMPLKSPKDDTFESIEAAKEVSKKLLNKYVEKYLFEFIPLSIPVNFTEKKNKLTGVVFQKVALDNGKIKPIKDSYFTLKTEMLISSIGSVPEQIDGLDYEYSSLKMRAEADYHVAGFDNVFAIGNAVTGKGNIQESKQHGKQMTELIMDKHLTEDKFEQWLINHNSQIQQKVQKQVHAIVKEIKELEIQPAAIIQEILDRTSEIHKTIRYTTYKDWIKRNTPIRLEDLTKNNESCKHL